MEVSKVYFMTKRVLTDLFENTKVDLCIEHEQVLGYYYIIFKEDKINTRGGNKPFKFDEDGVPLIHSYIDVDEDKGYYYYPITIGQYGLSIFHQYLRTRDSHKKDHFIRIAEWFTNNAVVRNNEAIWLTLVPKPEYKIFQPWKSAFSQSRAISILLRAWQLTSRPEFLDLATRALIPFTKDITDGGVSVDLKSGRTFYEEYVAEKPTRVLDGHIFALFGVYDYIRAITDEYDRLHAAIAKEIFNNGVNGLINWLPDFDMGYWVYYNQCELDDYPKEDVCTLGYMRLISNQLEILSGLSRQDVFLDYAAKFRSYITIPNIIKYYRMKYKALKSLNRI